MKLFGAQTMMLDMTSLIDGDDKASEEGLQELAHGLLRLLMHTEIEFKAFQNCPEFFDV